MNEKKPIFREVGIGLGLGLLTNLIWAAIFDQLSPFIIAVVFLVSLIVYYLLWNFLIRPILLTHKLRIKAIYDEYEKAKPDVKRKLETASVIKIISIGGGTIAEAERGAILDILEKRTKAGESQIRILIANPQGSGLQDRLKELEKIHPGKFDPEGLSKSIFANVRKITSRSCDIELRLYDSKPVWRLFILDELAYVSAYLSDREGHESQMTVFEKGSDLFSAYERLFDVLWHSSKKPEEL